MSRQKVPLLPLRKWSETAAKTWAEVVKRKVRSRPSHLRGKKHRTGRSAIDPKAGSKRGVALRKGGQAFKRDKMCSSGYVFPALRKVKKRGGAKIDSGHRKWDLKKASILNS